MHRIKLRQLETFMVFMKTGSVTEAAEMLGTTQPNASKALKQAEEAIGIPLFTRRGGRLLPTSEAEVLYGHVARLMDGVDFIERLSLDLGQIKKGYIRIACLATFGLSLLPTVVARFNASHPGVPVELDVVDSEKVHLLVSREHYDFGIVHRPERADGLNTEVLGTGRFVCLVSRVHPLADEPAIHLKHLAGQRLVTYPASTLFGSALRRTFEEHDIRFPGTIFANHSAVVRELLEAGCGDIAIIDEFAAWNMKSSPAFSFKPLVPEFPVSVGLIVPARRPLSLAATAFVAELRATLEHPATHIR